MFIGTNGASAPKLARSRDCVLENRASMTALTPYLPPSFQRFNICYQQIGFYFLNEGSRLLAVKGALVLQPAAVSGNALNLFAVEVGN